MYHVINVRTKLIETEEMMHGGLLISLNCTSTRQGFDYIFKMSVELNVANILDSRRSCDNFHVFLPRPPSLLPSSAL